MDNSPQSQLLWYGIRVRSKFERVVSGALAGKGYEQFLPLYSRPGRPSGSSNVRNLPLFPGYLFCRIDIRNRLLPIFTTPGVVAIVGAGKHPIPIPFEQIEAIQRVMRSGLYAEPWPRLAVGTKVLIEQGPLAGVEGIVALDGNKRHRLILSIEMLHRSVSVEIDRDWVHPLSDGIDPRLIAARHPNCPVSLSR
jgi:transcription antitermination factor NusG